MTASQEKWQQAKSLFQAAIDLPPDEREEYIRSSCDDLSIRSEVIRMVELHMQSGDFLVSPLSNRTNTGQEAGGDFGDRLIGQHVDDFRLVRRIGAGGMGAVYEARQTHPVRQAAVKVLRITESISNTELARFKHESQALARLQHPGIAHVYAAGSHDFGNGAQPWFAMEYIDGQPLDRYLAQFDLSLEQKLELLLLVCDAVQHAHDREVIHRDLKPANILIVEATESCPAAAPKVVDFGVARIADPDRKMTLQTVAGEIVGTLNYMSPESVVGGAGKTDHRTDLFALAVIGFEMLTGKLPYEPRSGSLVESIRHIATAEPKRLKDCESRLRGDLDVIFAKALEGEPARRYSAVRTFADDVRRYLNREPILARPPSTVYRMRKFASRNRALVGGVVATILALSIGLVLFAVEASRAREAAARSQYEADKASAVNAFITNDFMMKLLVAAKGDPAEVPPTTIELVDMAAANVGSMFGERPAIEAAVRNEVGTIYYNLGALEQAATQFRQALELWESSVGSNHSDTLKAVNNLGQSLIRLNQPEEAEALYQRALDGRMQLLGESDPQTLASMNNMAELYRQKGRLDEAERLLRKSVRLQKQVLGPSDKNTLISMANLGSLLIQRGSIDEARELHVSIWEITRETLGDDHITTLQFGSRAAQTLHRAGEEDQALAILAPVLQRFERFRGNDHGDTITNRRLMARIYASKKNWTAANEQLQLALDGALRHPEAMSDLVRKIQSELHQLETNSTSVDVSAK